MIFSIRSAFLVFVSVIFFGAWLAAATEFPRSEDTEGLYRIKVLSPTPNQTYRTGQKIILCVDTAKPLSMEILYYYGELIFTSHLMQVGTQNITFGVVGEKPVDGNKHKYRVVTDGKLPPNNYTLRKYLGHSLPLLWTREAMSGIFTKPSRPLVLNLQASYNYTTLVCMPCKS
jgi:hypothetical protein